MSRAADREIRVYIGNAVAFSKRDDPFTTLSYSCQKYLIM